MPMGIVSDADFEKELERIEQKESSDASSTASTGRVIDIPKRGRVEGTKEVPDSLRKLIGDESTTHGRQSALELAQSFGLSPSAVSAYSVGATSTATYDKRPNSGTITDAKVRISNVAKKKLLMAMHHITAEKLGDAKARDLAGIAKDMSAVMRNMEPDSPVNKSDSGPSFVVYSPTFKQENNYDSIVVKE